MGALRTMLWAALASGAAAQEAAPENAAQRARELAREFAVPARARQAVREFVRCGEHAIAPLHLALHDKDPDVRRWALFACCGLRGDLPTLDSLREPVRMLERSADLGVALYAQRAARALDCRGVTLIADYQGNRAFEILRDGSERERTTGRMTMGATALGEGRLLVSIYGDNRVVEFDAAGHEVWSFAGVRHPSDAERLPNGNTLIADSGGRRAIEVNPGGEIVWCYDDDVRPIDADRLGNGNTLLANYRSGGVLEVDQQGRVVWQVEGGNVRDADRLVDGTTLVTFTDEKQIRLLAPDKTVLHTWTVGFDPNDAELLPDGNLLVAGNGLVLLSPAGETLWQHRVGYAGRVAQHGR